MSKLFPNYTIDLDKGTIFSIKRKRLLNPTNDGYGHFQCAIKDCYDNIYTYVHQVIYAEGNSQPKHLWPIDENGRRYEIDHIKPTRDGGTDTLFNLRLVSHKNNMNNSATTDFLSSITKGRIPSDETKKKMSENASKHFLGKHHSEESKKKMSESRKGKVSPRKGVHLSEETKKKLSESHSGKPSGRAIPIDQIDPKTGEIIKTWNSATEAKQDGFDSKKISACANGYPKCKTHKGYIWKKHLP